MKINILKKYLQYLPGMFILLYVLFVIVSQIIK